MNILQELRQRLQQALTGWIDSPQEAAQQLRPSGEAKFGDYQANCAMPLAKKLGRPPTEVAQEIVDRLDCADLCDIVEIAGPGFINFRLKSEWLTEELQQAVSDPRLRVTAARQPRKYVVDYSAPNVAKPMHVGHIRSTVIGDTLCRTLRFLGHEAISDNHIGDWGTQFGMILYGYQNFLNKQAYEQSQVGELARLYKLVNSLVDYQANRTKRPQLAEKLSRLAAEAAQTTPVELPPGAKPTPEQKQQQKAAKRAADNLGSARRELAELDEKIAQIENDPERAPLAKAHPGIGEAVLRETALLHAGDPLRRQLWEEFLPCCLEEIQRIYDRLGVKFDYTLGESFYQDQLAGVVEDLQQRGIAQESDGAICVFLPGETVPMIIRKKDGAFLYATTDLATIQYRMTHWQPDAILYVVDHRQSMHFEHLFATAQLWGYENVELKHVSFGTVLGEDGRPFKTRSGQSVGLESLLDEAVERAATIVAANDDAMPDGPEMDATARQQIAERVGIAALKYADLSQNRSSDYVFSYDKMLAMNGNTATYMQYAYARVRSIFSRGGVDAETLRASGQQIQLTEPAERQLGLALLRFEEALASVLDDYRPNQLTGYLFDLAGAYSTFFEQCHVLRAESEEIRQSRLLLCDLTARTLKQGLELLGIDVIERM